MRIKNVSKAELHNMIPWVRKSWSTRVRRWLKWMREEIWTRDPWLDSTKRKVRGWVMENVRRKGDDAVLWGKWDEEDLREEKLEEECPRPIWTEKQRRRREEPPRKKPRRSTYGEKGGKADGDGGRVETKDGNEDKEDESVVMEESNKTKETIGKKDMAKLGEERRERLKLRKETRERNRLERARKKMEKKED